MKRTFLVTMELDTEVPLDPDFDRGVTVLDLGEDAFHQRLNGLFEGTLRGTRVIRVQEIDPALETPRMLVLSTSHITQKTDSNLEWQTDDVPLFYPKNARGDVNESYGWIIPLVADNPWSHMISADLVAIRQLAEAAGCTWVMLDQAGEVVEGLPTYEW